MRDFRDAKAMAHTLRAALAAKGFKITVGQSLEMIAELFGVADWNTLAAAIRHDTRNAPKGASPSSYPATEPAPARSPHPPSQQPKAQREGPVFSKELELTLMRALVAGNERDHEYATLEHLLFALTDDAVASAVMKDSNVDVGALKENVAAYLDNELKALVKSDDGRDCRPTAAFQRVVQRALDYVQDIGRDGITGGDLLMTMFEEKESPAVWLLGEQGMTQSDAANFIERLIIPFPGD